MHLRKMRKKWQCIVRHKGHMITQSFVAKSDARLWGERTNTELRNGNVIDITPLINDPYWLIKPEKPEDEDTSIPIGRKN